MLCRKMTRVHPVVSFPLNNNNNKGQQYNIGEKPTVILYTYINHHVGTPKQKQTIVIIQFFGLKVPD